MCIILIVIASLPFSCLNKEKPIRLVNKHYGISPVQTLQSTCKNLLKVGIDFHQRGVDNFTLLTQAAIAPSKE